MWKQDPRSSSGAERSKAQWCRPKYLLWCAATKHFSFCTSLWQSHPFISIPLQVKQKLWHFKDYLYFSSAVETPLFSLLLIWFVYLQISTTDCTRKYPASSKNVFAEKRKNQRPFKKGNHNIISIFSFRCLNWHEEYNQISLLTVTRMPLQEREKYRLPAYISCQDFFFLPFFSFFWQVCVHYGAQVVRIYVTSSYICWTHKHHERVF